MLLVGSPMCTAFSTWQMINNKISCPVTVAADLRRAKEHLAFCVELYRLQARGGRNFLHGHPAYAPELGKELAMRCSGRSGNCSRPEVGTHAQCCGKTARMAAMYHFKVCCAILVGFRNQLTRDGKCKEDFIGMLDSLRED